MQKKIKFFILSIVAVLAGCAANVSQDVAPDLSQNALLLLPVTDRARFATAGTVLVASNSSGADYRLSVSQWPNAMPPNDGQGTKFYGVFVLPPGEYKFISWYHIHTEFDAAKAPAQPFSFTLKKGDIVYLGNFNTIRTAATGQFRDGFEEDMKQYRSLYPWMKSINVKREQIKSTWWALPGGRYISDSTQPVE